jgi:hypothetical protein
MEGNTMKKANKVFRVEVQKKAFHELKRCIEYQGEYGFELDATEVIKECFFISGNYTDLDMRDEVTITELTEVRDEIEVWDGTMTDPEACK